jgi:hypothetical protein
LEKTAEQPALVKSLYDAGFSLRRINDETGTPHEKARLMLHGLGVRMRHSHPIFSRPVAGANERGGSAPGTTCRSRLDLRGLGIVVNSSDTDMAGTVFSLAKNLLGLEPYLSRTKSTISIKSGKKQAKDFFLRYGFTKGHKAGSVVVAFEILRSNDAEILKSFLRGIFSADGCFAFRKRGARCVLQVSSAALRDGFVELASRIGFDFRKYDYAKTTGLNKLPIHIAYMGRREHVFCWMQQVGSISDGHHRRFSEWKALVRM